MTQFINYILWLRGKMERLIVIQMHNSMPDSLEEEVKINDAIRKRCGDNVVVLYDELKLPASIQYVYFKKK